jgi:hypothetical protein
MHPLLAAWKHSSIAHLVPGEAVGLLAFNRVEVEAQIAGDTAANAFADDGGSSMEWRASMVRSKLAGISP